MSVRDDAGIGTGRRGRAGSHYRMLSYFGAISTTIALGVALIGGLIVVALLFTMTEATAGAQILLATGVGVATGVSAVSIAVAADVARWMHDVVDLLDEQVEAVDALRDDRGR